MSTGLTLRVGNSPVGTPGFMAPELFDKVGQEISSEKVRREEGERATRRERGREWLRGGEGKRNRERERVCV